MTLDEAYERADRVIKWFDHQDIIKDWNRFTGVRIDGEALKLLVEAARKNS